MTHKRTPPEGPNTGGGVRIAAGVLGCRAGPVGVEMVGWLASSRPAGLGMAAAGQQLGRVFGATAGQHPGHPPAPRPRCPPDRHQVTQRSAASLALFTLSGEPLRTILPREKVLLHHRPRRPGHGLRRSLSRWWAWMHAGPVAAHRLACAHALRQRHCTGLASGAAGLVWSV
jgi:hypothetical protein